MYCGIDVGTTNTKVLVFDDDFKVVFCRKFRTPVISSKEGDLLSSKKLFAKILSSLKVIPEGIKEKIKAIGISSLGETVFPISKNGEVLQDGMMWYNKNVLEEYREFLEKVPPAVIFKKTGLWPSWIYSVFKMKRFYKSNKELTEKVYKWLDVTSLIAFLLTGNVAMDRAHSSRTLLMNILTGKWDEELVEASGISKKHLPEVVDSGVSRGRIREEVSKETGLPKDTVVTTAGQDHITASYAAGVHDETKLLDSSGTTEAVLWTIGRETLEGYLKKAPKMFQAGFHCIPGKYYLLTGLPTGGFCIDWLLNKILKKDYSVFRTFGYQKNTVFFFPYLRGTFDREEIGGAFFNLKDADDRDVIISAVLESTAFEMRSCLNEFEKLGLKDYEIVATGGGSQLREWLKVKASVFGRVVKVLSVHESVALGAAMIAKIAKIGQKNWEGFFKEASQSFEYEYFYPDKSDYFQKKYLEYLKLRNRIYGF
ncbi:FGGY-family carbohydrate kinase [Thermotoga sp.]|uniref:FGGY-family carbohydrate kinase n=1 Tax=Thermotoga sp. TaxID=28240 RepID=UPI0025E60D29|nr:FGGY-family carbohydrate kinase [Thermotoga sp.]MCD6552354.1 carbohydrate kinase [Thermotoga sp.]